MKKRFLSALMTLVMLCSLVPLVQTDAQAYAGTADGQAIVNTAKQYIGKVPYVWGGEKIDGSNPGADCSGFVCRIYEKFGYDLWDYRTGLRRYGINLGTNLNTANPLPGDLIWYEGHIAIYAGKQNGSHMIVHETGGSYQNVVYTKASIVSAALKGIIRLPGINGASREFYGKISGADGYLSVNNSAKSTSAGAKQVAQIPNGKTCTVYTNKSSGKWWYVEYGGVKGWAYSSYITLTGIKGQAPTASTTQPETPPASTTPTASSLGVSFTQPSQATYKDKIFVGNTNAMMCNQITKNSGVKVTKMGMHLYDAGGKLLKTHSENVTGLVSNTNTKYHSWYDMNSEVGVTLTPGTAYKYQFFGVFNGVECKGPMFSFTTTGTAPAKTFTATFVLNEYGNAVTAMDVTQGQAYGTLPQPREKDGYSFEGWYTAQTGGTRITSSTVFNGSGDITLYPHYEALPAEEPPAEEPPVEEPPVVEPPVEEPPVEEPPVANEPLVIQMQIGNPSFSVNGQWQKIDAQGSKPVLNTDNRTILPVRAVFEAMGGTVGWDGNSQVVSLTLEDATLYLRINSNMMWDSRGQYMTMDTVPVLINGRTLLPIRPLVEYFNGSVGWDGAREMVTIQYAP